MLHRSIIASSTTSSNAQHANSTDKVYLNVPFLQKSWAKRSGASWDFDAKKWFISNELFLTRKEQFRKWLLPACDSIDTEADVPTYILPPIIRANIRKMPAAVDASGPISPVLPSSEAPTAVSKEAHADKTDLVMFYDTETTGLYSRSVSKPVHFSDLQRFESCRVVQMSYALCEKDDFTVVEIGDILIQANGFVIENAHIHGITQERSLTEGIPFLDAAKKFASVCSRATYLVAHNAEFDVLATKSELFRHSLNDELSTFNNLKVICSMTKTKNIVNCKGKNGQIKNPKLKELYEFALGVPIENEHNAMADVLNMLAAVRVLVTTKKLVKFFD